MDTCVQIENEFWLPVPGYVGWVDASTAGRIRRWYQPARGRRSVVMLDAPAIVHPSVTPYRCAVSIRNATGNSAPVAVHTAVLLAWVGERKWGFVGCHFPNANTADNALSNLRWDHYHENNYDELSHKTNTIEVVQERLDKLRTTHRHLRESADGCWFSRESPLRSAP